METVGQTCEGCGAETDGDALCSRCEGAAPAAASPPGARQLRAVAVTLLGSLVLMGLWGAPLPSVALFFILQGLLLLWTRRGGQWSRWVLAALALLGAFNLGSAAVGQAGVALAIYVAMAVLHVGCALALGFSPAIKAYVEAEAASSEA